MLKMHPKVVEITQQLNIVQRLLLLIPAAGISYFIAAFVGPTIFEAMYGRGMIVGHHFILTIYLFASLTILVFQINKDRTLNIFQKILLLLPTYGVLYIPSMYLAMLLKDMGMVGWREMDSWGLGIAVAATASIAVFIFKIENSQLELKETDSFSEMEQNNGSSPLVHDAQNKIDQETSNQLGNDEKQHTPANHDPKVELKQQLEALEKAYNVGILSKSEYDSKKSSINSRVKDI